MSTSSAGTNSATEDGTRISETATQFGASPYGESQSSATTSPAKNHRLELDAKVADLANIIEGNTTLGLASSTYFGGASGPEDRSISHNKASPFQLANGIAPRTTVGSSTAPTSGARGSDNTDNADTQPTSIIDDVASEDSKSEGPATDEARRGTDSDPSDHSEGSDRSNGGSPDPTTIASDVTAAWGSDIASQQPVYPTAISIVEIQGTTTASQSNIRETVDHTRETQNAPSQHSGTQSSGARSRHDPHHRNHGLVNYKQPPGLSADDHPETSPLTQSPPASSPTLHVDVQQRDPKGERHITKLLKRTVTVVGLVAAFVALAYECKHDVLLACTVVIMIAGVDSMIQGF